MRLSILIPAVCCLFGSIVAQGAEPSAPPAPASGDAVVARGLYVQGDSQYKKGDLVGAIKTWAHVMEIKPDSDFTQKCLTKARNELYTRYTGLVSKGTYSEDPVGCLAMIDALTPLLPDKPELVTQRASVDKIMSEDQRQAYKSYTEAMACSAKNDLAGARKAMEKATKYAPSSQCIKDGIRTMGIMPKILFFYTTWCPHCKDAEPIIQSIQTQYKDKIEVSYIDKEKDKPAAEKYGVSGIPHIIFLDSDGTIVKEIVGGPAKGKAQEFRDYVQKCVAKMGVK